VFERKLLILVLCTLALGVGIGVGVILQKATDVWREPPQGTKQIPVQVCSAPVAAPCPVACPTAIEDLSRCTRGWDYCLDERIRDRHRYQECVDTRDMLVRACAVDEATTAPPATSP
jgi:hypothetical protein